jgi:hypothetical protein
MVCFYGPKPLKILAVCCFALKLLISHTCTSLPACSFHVFLAPDLRTCQPPPTLQCHKASSFHFHIAWLVMVS